MILRAADENLVRAHRRENDHRASLAGATREPDLPHSSGRWILVERDLGDLDPDARRVELALPHVERAAAAHSDIAEKRVAS